MSAEKTLKVALLGCGNVGSQVARLLREEADELAVRIGARLELADGPAGVHRCPGHVGGRGLEEPSYRRRAEAELRDAEPGAAHRPPIHERAPVSVAPGRSRFTPPGSSAHDKTSDVSNTARSWHAGPAHHKGRQHVWIPVLQLDCKAVMLHA